jgi:hypothetical protein
LVIDQLTQLELVRCHFEANASTSAMIFLALNTLKIYNTRIDGAFHDHFILPVLKELYLHDVMFVNTGNGRRTPISKTFSGFSFHSIPELTSLHLVKLNLGEELTNTLQGYPLLQELIVEDCIDNKFMSSFMGCLERYVNSFPNLQRFHFRGNWPRNLNMSYEEFTRWHENRRPHINVQ